MTNTGAGQRVASAATLVDTPGEAFAESKLISLITEFSFHNTEDETGS
jgi:hypothetical protein